MDFVNFAKNLYVPGAKISKTAIADGFFYKGAVALFVLDNPDSVIETIELFYVTKSLVNTTPAPHLTFVMRLKEDTTSEEHMALIDALCSAKVVSSSGKRVVLCTPHYPIFEYISEKNYHEDSLLTLFLNETCKDGRKIRQVIPNVKSEDIGNVVTALVHAAF